jgi:hypothetical protein
MVILYALYGIIYVLYACALYPAMLFRLIIFSVVYFLDFPS